VVVTLYGADDREGFLLGVIKYMDEMDPWYLDQAPEWVEKLKEEYNFSRKENA